MSRIFYHYSNTPFDELRSKTSQGLVGRDSDPRQYGKNISLFFEPIPLDIPSILHNQHHFWKSGVELWCHEINELAIPENILYYITETPDKINLLYNVQDWTAADGNSNLIAKYIHQIKVMEKRKHYVGSGRVNFVRYSAPFTKGIGKYYKDMYELSLRNPEDKLMDKYGAAVPHAMLYPDMTPITVSRKYIVKLN